jgi:hypothetical protein
MTFEAATNFGPIGLTQHVTGNDPKNWLPPAAAEKLRALEQRINDLYVIIPETQLINDVRAELTSATNRVKHLMSARSGGGFAMAEDHPTVVDSQKRAAAAKAELQRLSELNEVRTAAWRENGYVIGNVNNFLRHGIPPGCVVELIEEDDVKLAKGEALAARRGGKSPTPRARIEGGSELDRGRAVSGGARQEKDARSGQRSRGVGCAGCFAVGRARSRRAIRR